MSTTFLYGLILAVGQIALTLLGFFLGFQTDKIQSGRWFGFLPLVLTIVMIIIGTRAVRDESAGGYMTYGKGVLTGFLITLYSCLIGMVYTYIHFTFVNPNFADYMIENARVQWAAKNMSEAQMEGAEKFMHFVFKPAVQACFVLIVGTIIGTIISLITAAALKKDPPAEMTA